MKKLICVIPITVLICILLSTTKVSAYEYVGDSPNIAVVHVSTGQWTGWYCVCSNRWNNLRFDAVNNNIYGDGIAPNRNAGYNGSSTYQAAINYMNNQGYLSTTSVSINVDTVIMYKGTLTYIQGSSSNIVFGSTQEYEDYLNPPPSPTPTPIPSWSKTMWDTLQEELGNPAFWFGEWFVDIIDQVFGNDEEPSQGPRRISDSTHIKQISPTPAPTPIPYSTITVPRTDIITGQTVYETNYYYVNPSGTPIVVTSPPINPPAQNDTGGGSGNDYNPVDPYSIPDVSWFTAAEIGDTSYDGIDSIMQGFDSIDTIGSDYSDGMSAVEDATGTLPTSWLLLIGIAAAIPLIAGIISRFLS